MERLGDFEKLSPDVVINAVEAALGKKMTGLLSTLPSYINRVYEMMAMDGTPIIAKFYRPGRWSRYTLEDEHQFLLDCVDVEIPAVAPMLLGGEKQSIHEIEGYYFSLFPKKHGRQFEALNDQDWIRLGALTARIHQVGASREAPARLELHPEMTTAVEIQELLDGDFVSAGCRNTFRDLSNKILDTIMDLFDEAEYIRIHGDCHSGNIIDRMDEGIMMIDFDDMMMGPPVQDLWLLLPGYLHDSRRELNLILEGYESFREFDDATLKLVEPLRMMRIIYFLSWCAKQIEDRQFLTHFPNWGTEDFWRQEIHDLEQQLKIIEEHKPVSGNR